MPLCLIKSFLQPSEHDLVDHLDLAIGLGVLNGSEVVLHFVASKETLEPLVDELSSVVDYHGVQNLEMDEDVLPNELLTLGSRDYRQWLHFYPLSEIIDCQC